MSALAISTVATYRDVNKQKIAQPKFAKKISHFKLSTQQQKMMLYIISKLKPYDDDVYTTDFDTVDFCKTCWINFDGENYSYLKRTIQALTRKSVWVRLDARTITLLRWLYSATINYETGKLSFETDDLLVPHLLELKRIATKHESTYSPAMKSKYGIKLYEILHCLEFEPEVEFATQTIKEKMLDASKYKSYKDFRTKVIDVAINEINSLSDINVKYEEKKTGRACIKIKFIVTHKENADERFMTWRILNDVIENLPLAWSAM
jgi:plasmid replication initiation protein